MQDSTLASKGHRHLALEAWATRLDSFVVKHQGFGLGLSSSLAVSVAAIAVESVGESSSC